METDKLRRPRVEPRMRLMNIRRQITLAATAATTFTLVAGCVGPAYVKPKVDTPTAFKEGSPAAYQGADLSNGEARFAVCRSCHTTAQGGEDMTGPNLWGIFGRKAGSEPGFAYSDDMKSAGWIWDADRIDKWITNPRGVLPGTKMTFIGMESPTDRRDVIAFLKTVTSAAPKG